MIDEPRHRGEGVPVGPRQKGVTLTVTTLECIAVAVAVAVAVVRREVVEEVAEFHPRVDSHGRVRERDDRAFRDGNRRRVASSPPSSLRAVPYERTSGWSS